jgi:hypothetical protein
MRNGIKSFHSVDGRHWYQRVGWRDGLIVWRMWSSWSNAKGIIDWVPVKHATMPKSLSRAGVVERMMSAT